MKKILISLAAVLCFTMSAKAVDDTMNPLITSMPSLSIAPDARAAGQGDIGVATEADFNSQYWNPAKYAYMYSKGGITANYTPWLRKLVGDIDLAYLAGFYNFGDLGGGIGASFTYFSMGNVALTDGSGNTIQNVRPNEWALDLSYFRKLHEYVSMSVAVRFLYSDLNNGYNSSIGGGTEMHPAWTMAADIALYYRQPLELPMGTSHLSLGITLKNLGGKMNYADDGSSNFIPASMNIGMSYELPCDKYNFLTFNVEANKLMVPSRKSRFTQGFDPNDESTWQMSQTAYSELNSAKGWFQSFADAPRGAKEEFQEVRWGAGIEYSYNKQFFARAGYSYENYYKGNRNYLTFGAGFHLSIVSLDVAYCVGLAASNPLDQTMRFTLGFDLAGIKDLVNNKKNK
ncbi:MAG: type IX secretion system outer membrane channel protein PorV [Paludibacteraceae bacterium]|nr:type IX secretion system outer membrane channel protein PorV [Paludibacteraceae bacterium]